MPRPPDTCPHLKDVGVSVYSNLAHRLAARGEDVYPLHIGDTWLDPPDGCRMQDILQRDHPGVHRYAPPAGLPSLVEAVAARVEARAGVPTPPEAVRIAAGATGGIGEVFGAILSPGDEVLVLAPYWPLVPGIVRSFRGVPVAVPYVGAVDGPAAGVAAVEAACTERTVALYVSSPNNPSGRLVPPDELEALAAFARRQGLWIVSDEVYEDCVFRGEHVPVRRYAPERTFSAHSFSKTYGMAGYRCGYVAGPAEVTVELAKIGTHTYYSTPTPAQVVAERALGPAGAEWLEAARERYREAGFEAARVLGVPAPEGSTFLFVDVSAVLDERGLGGFLEDAVDRGLCVAPGPSFGPYPGHVRLCFTAAPPDRVRRGTEILAELIAR